MASPAQKRKDDFMDNFSKKQKIFLVVIAAAMCCTIGYYFARCVAYF